jgi:hypothetical protein
MLKYEKAKSKLIEFNIEKNNYPNFPLNSDDLTYSTFYALSLYCEELIDNPNSIELPELFKNITFVSQYFDSTVKTNQRIKYNNLFLLLGATAYFLSENFGSAKVLIEQINEWNIKNEVIALLYSTLLFLLKINHIEISTNNKNIINYVNYLKRHFLFGETHENIYIELNKMRKAIYLSSNVYSINYIDFLYAIVICAVKHSTWILLQKYSNINIENWKKQFFSLENMKLLWPAQKVIIEAGVLTGKNIVVPLPTGVGKTKSVEIILHSKFIAQGTYVVAIIAPYKALCNEIINDLIPAFANEAVINQFTDTAQEDFDLEILSNKKYIFVCTPEKFTYIFRHEPNFLSAINLFIFDEAHLFDDDIRGAQYELLMSEINQNKNAISQMIFFSAVLSNANQISAWLFQSETSIIDYSKVKSTEKSIGFLSSDQTIHFYEKDNMGKESFYIPKSIEYTTLKYNIVFPKDNVQDISIYYANKLCNRGGVAIYSGQVRSIIPIMRRILDIYNRGYDLTNLTKYGNNKEINKLFNLFILHYGEVSELTQASKLGAFPHYSDLPNGIKMSIEYALRKKHIYFVVCTTTLAEGVNIPIKYLFLTTFRYGNNKMQIRKIQNLVGRTARSGLYTEGSTIVTDSNYYNNRSNFTGGGIYRWQECKKMFDYENAEACESSILSLVNNIDVDYKYSYPGHDLSTYIIKYYGNESCFLNLQEIIRNDYRNYVSEKTFKIYNHIIDLKINQIKRVIETIENYLCYLFNSIQDINIFLESSNKLAQLTYAYYLASDEKKQILRTIFCLIAEKIVDKIKPEKKAYFSKSLYGIETSIKILSWVDQCINIIKDYSIENINKEIIKLFKHLFNELIDIPIDTFIIITEMWINGKSYIDIYNEIGGTKNIELSRIEKLCSNTISYHLSFLIGNIIDAISDRAEELNNKLILLQKQVKHGVPSKFQIFICENIFDDKIIAKQLDIALGNIQIQDNEFSGFIVSKQQEILKILNNYPEYFSNKLKMYIRK